MNGFEILKSQLDRMEEKQNLYIEHMIKQAEKNGAYDSHLDNHRKCTRAFAWLTGISLTVLGLLKIK